MEKTQDMSKYDTLLKAAKEASEKAYAPYSNFPVGAAALFDSGKIYTGVNVENVSYGLSLCAERNAVASAISQGEKGKLLAVGVYSPKQKNCLPCGACRQWFSEFMGDVLEVVVEGENSCLKVYDMSELLPHGFKMH